MRDTHWFGVGRVSFGRSCADGHALAQANEAIDYLQTKFSNGLAHKTKYRGIPTVKLEAA
jgi:hypothetical protein